MRQSGDRASPSPNSEQLRLGFLLGEMLSFPALSRCCSGIFPLLACASKNGGREQLVENRPLPQPLPCKPQGSVIMETAKAVEGE